MTGGPGGLWGVEERIDAARSVSIQMETGPGGTKALFSGGMRTVDGAFTGYLSPLPAPAARVAATLEAWGHALGGLLAARGYAGPFGLDAMVTPDGEVFAGERNVRRTATTTPRAMVARLAARSGAGDPAWATGKVRPRPRTPSPRPSSGCTANGSPTTPYAARGSSCTPDRHPTA